MLIHCNLIMMIDINQSPVIFLIYIGGVTSQQEEI